ncbi:MAG TPA: hypothetical protein PKW82_10540 [Spirochaetales bacterium]|nr:hypothetical protein [Spirochaetales bacterium]
MNRPARAASISLILILVLLVPAAFASSPRERMVASLLARVEEALSGAEDFPSRVSVYGIECAEAGFDVTSFQDRLSSAIIDTGMFKGFKPMTLSPVLKPEYAARKIVDGAKKGKPYVMLPPHSIYSTMFLKLLPTHWFDWLLKMSGAERAMDCFEGRKSC